MRRSYHLPTDVGVPDGLPARDRQVLGAVVLAAVGRAVRAAAPGETARPAAGPRPQPRERVAGAGGDAYAVPSYGDAGNKVGIPVAGQPQRAAAAVPGDGRDPADPHNRLTARELFDIWMRYWTVRHNEALRHEREVRRSVWRIDVVAFTSHERKFRLGDRGAHGPAYRAAADELDFCQWMASAATELLVWLEVQEKKGTPVTFEQANRAAASIARGLAFNQTWVQPLLLAVVGGASVRSAETGAGAGRPPASPRVPAATEQPPASPRVPAATEQPPASPRPPGGGWIARTARNAVARAMIGLSEAESATRMATGSPAVTEPARPLSGRPPATMPSPAAQEPSARPASQAPTAPAPQAPAVAPAAPTPATARPDMRAATVISPQTRTPAVSRPDLLAEYERVANSRMAAVVLDVLRGRRTTATRTRLAQLRQQFDQLRRQVGNGPMTPAQRSAATAVLREARDLARADFDNVRKAIWRRLRADPDLLRIERRLQAAGDAAQGGSALRVSTRTATGTRFEALGVEHRTRLSDDPWRYDDPANLIVTDAPQNEQYLEALRRHGSIWPTGDVEDFVIRHRLNDQGVDFTPDTRQ
ncbi:hypothetical protein [Streptomyces sp. GbtcB6]|uniref:hypothetical protein n=1 Tax=Streptomyces sp. GbtcB6 TaxID=2824751 RepID=UPI001C300ED3|nr:hypothetical protein [Streptomyces sp. GbtcB6]